MKKSAEAAYEALNRIWDLNLNGSVKLALGRTLFDECLKDLS